MLKMKWWLVLLILVLALLLGEAELLTATGLIWSISIIEGLIQV